MKEEGRPNEEKRNDLGEIGESHYLSPIKAKRKEEKEEREEGVGSSQEEQALRNLGLAEGKGVSEFGGEVGLDVGEEGRDSEVVEESVVDLRNSKELPEAETLLLFLNIIFAYKGGLESWVASWAALEKNERNIVQSHHQKGKPISSDFVKETTDERTRHVAQAHEDLLHSHNSSQGVREGHREEADSSSKNEGRAWSFQKSGKHGSDNEAWLRGNKIENSEKKSAKTQEDRAEEEGVNSTQRRKEVVGQEGGREDVGKGEAGNDESIVEEVEVLVREHGGEEGHDGEEGDVDSRSGEEDDEERTEIHKIRRIY